MKQQPVAQVLSRRIVSGLMRLMQRVDEASTLVFLSLPEGKVIVRVDGLVVKVSGLAYDLLHGTRDLPTQERLEWAEREYGAAPLVECYRELEELDESVDLFRVFPRRGTSDLPAGQPGGVVLLVSQACNLACVYCYADGGSYGSETPLMRPDTATAAIDYLLRRSPDRKRYSVIFFGGEPLVNYGLIAEVVEYCELKERKHGKRFSYSITTNGTILSDEILSFLKSKGFAVMVSIDGPSPRHDANRPFSDGHGSYALVAANTRRMVEAGIPVQLRATLVHQSINDGSVGEMIETAQRLGVKRVTLSPVGVPAESQASHRLREGDLQELATVYGKVVEENLTRAERCDDNAVVFDPYVRAMRSLSTGKARGMGRCGACSGMAAVSTDGGIYPCHRFVGMEPYAIGDVSGGVSPDRVAEFYASVDEACSPVCAACWAREICCGICHHALADGAGGFREPNGDECKSFRAGLKGAISGLLRLRQMSPMQRQAYGHATKHL